MFSMSLFLYEYLMREHRLFLPSVGEISLRSSRPELNLEQGVFHPRHYQYAFNDKEDLRGLEDLENFIAKKMNCVRVEASKAIYSWVSKVNKHCSHAYTYKWFDVGEFAYDQNNGLVFRPLPKKFSFWQEVLFIRSMADVKKGDSKDYKSSSYTDENYDFGLSRELVKSEKETNILDDSGSKSDSVKQEDVVESSLQFAPVNEVAEVETTADKEEEVKPLRVYTEFVELDAPERYGLLHKIFVIILILAGFLYIFLHLFLNDFSFHSYVR